VPYSVYAFRKIAGINYLGPGDAAIIAHDRTRSGGGKMGEKNSSCRRLRER
jgi:hypothetical protein